MTENTKTLDSLLQNFDKLSDFDKGRLIGQGEVLASLEHDKDKKEK